MFWPVWGFLPFRSALSTTRKEPNPVMMTFSPYSIALAI